MSQKVSPYINKILTKIPRLDQGSIQVYLAGLIREKEQIEQILNLIKEGVLVFGEGGVVKFANRMAHLWLGFERYSKDRTHVKNLLGDSVIRQFVIERLNNANQQVVEEFNVLTPREMSLRVHWIPYQVDEEMNILLGIENITQEKNRSEQEEDVQRIESLTRLAAGVAHEIGNPLNSLQIHLELLKQEASKLPKGKRPPFTRLLEILSSETKRLDHIVRSFLRASRRPPLRFKKESINEVIAEAVSFLAPELKRMKIQLRTDLDTKIHPFLIDRDRLHQTFINLIKNAIEAMPNGGSLFISTKLSGKICLLRFEDNGAGIEESDLPHIFEPYYTTKEEGSGLGLSQVYQAVREHGGRIDVKSQLKKGSIFTLALPLRQEPLSLPVPIDRPSERKGKVPV